MQRDTVPVPVPDISNICLDLRALFDYVALGLHFSMTPGGL